MRKLTVVAYRTSWLVFGLQLVASFIWDFSWWWGWIPLGSAIVLAFLINRPRASPRSPAPSVEPVEVDPPVIGRWSALNSPADKVPSHGTWGYGQSHAIDLIAESSPSARSHGSTATTRPAFGWWPIMRRNHRFPGFGAEVVAVAEGTVVLAVDRHRDHLSRDSFPGLVYLSFESMVREMAGPGPIIGNRVILDLGDGVYALYAHLRRGSLAVRVGDRVKPGTLLARCGNSGNSTEPHVHFQLMDNVDVDVARGIPFRWRGMDIPKGGQVFTSPSGAGVR